MRVLIIDDERLAREELRELLRIHTEITVIGEAANGPQALPLIAELAPDLLLLDIQMPEMDGFQLLSRLAPPVPKVIFVTAFDRFAIHAFTVNALDYLLKPVEPARLASALQRVNCTASPSSVESTSEVTHSSLPPQARVFVRDGERCWFVALHEIILLEAEGNATRIYFGQENPLLSRSLAALELKLPPQLFFRASRSHIVNTHYIQSVEPWFSKSLRVHLGNGMEVEFSRRQALLFRETRSL
jgi:two-component system, LytTR family, response regulator